MKPEPQIGARANCDRCGREIQVAPRRSEDSKPFRLAVIPKGVCPDCVMTQFLYNTYPINMQIDEAGPELLLKPMIREVFVMSGLLEECDMSIDEVNWQRVVANWNLPVENKPGPTNPYRMGDSARGKQRLREVEDGVVAGDDCLTAALVSVGVSEDRARRAIESDTGTLFITQQGTYRLPELRKRRSLRMIIENCRFCRGRGCLSCEAEQRKQRRADEQQDFDELDTRDMKPC